jgi:hypothetical protein
LLLVERQGTCQKRKRLTLRRAAMAAFQRPNSSEAHSRALGQGFLRKSRSKPVPP